MSPCNTLTLSISPNHGQMICGGGGGGHLNHPTNANPSPTRIRTVQVNIHCPSNNVTYEGYILRDENYQHYQQRTSNSHKRNGKKRRDIDQRYYYDTGGGGGGSDNLRPKAVPEPSNFIKHGKGIIDDHTNGMTLTGYFQNNEIVGHALQTLYDHPTMRRQIVAQYEGSFMYLRTTSPSSIYLPHGKGKYTWQSTNDSYIGEFYEGVMQGEGTFVWGSTGDRYEGSFKKGLPHGRNGRKFIMMTGDESFGSWKKGQAHGWGLKMFGNGDVFEGMYSRDLRQGFGVYMWNNGDCYAGLWENGSINGRGVKSLVRLCGNDHDENDNDGDGEGEAISTLLPGGYAEVYNGELENDQAHGSGVKHYACGDTYHGHFQNDKRDGYGVYEWANGDMYSGYFSNGSCCGKGLKRMADGDIYDGEWLDDKCHGYGVKTIDLTGCIHMGQYKNDERHGHGYYRWGYNGDEYEGDFVDGDQSGFGEYRWNNATLYRGRWSKGKKHGSGYLKIQVRNIERVYFETWSQGKRIYRQVVYNSSLEDLPTTEQLRAKHECLNDLVKQCWIAQI